MGAFVRWSLLPALAVSLAACGGGSQQTQDSTADAELVELVWVELGSKPLADLHPMTKNVLNELDRRLASGPLSHDAPVPFFHFYGGKMQKDVLGA